MGKRARYESSSDEISSDDSIASDDSLNDFIVSDDDDDDDNIDDIGYMAKSNCTKNCTRDCTICELDVGHKVYNKMMKDKYFRDLCDNDKMNYIKQQNEINIHSSTLMPIRYRILSSSMDIKDKLLIISRIEEFNKLSEDSSEYGKLKKWIDGISKIPYGNYVSIPITIDTSDNDKYKFLCNVNIKLNRSIYGQLKAKNKILQIVSQLISNPDARGTIIALEGDPGVGKTSLIKNGLADALNIPCCLIALGGVSDSSILEGHSFTYEGSSWGRIMDNVMRVGCMNPIFFFDELDKVSKTEKGQEIIGSLMHLTDKSQNDKFHDIYFGLDFDLSRSTMIFSCNDRSEISYILNDRIEYIKMDGYGVDDKIEIARNYMIPEININIGLKQSDVLINTECLRYIIKNYTRESGVRKLRECLDIIYSKINLMRYVRNNTEIKIEYMIENFKFPIRLNNNLIKKLLA